MSILEPQTEQSLQDSDFNDLLEPTEFLADICVVIPAYNEALVIEDSLKALAQITDLAHVFVVSDGSKDNTAELARKHTDNVLEIVKNGGKALALEQLIAHFGLSTKYRYILFSDADSQLDPHFFEAIHDAAQKLPACIVGSVVSQKKGLVSAYRTVEYALTQLIFKQAQSYIGTIAVAPGCASAYRSDVLRELHFGGGTLTEDYDLTLQIHAQRLGPIIYAPKARVLTQDPLTIGDYWKQIIRWHTGFWQNFFLHRVYFPRRSVHYEILVLTLDSISWIAVITASIFFPVEFLRLLVLSLTVSWTLTAAVIIIEKTWWTIPYLPLFPFFQLMNIIGYTYSFGRAVLGGKKLGWDKVQRY